MLKATSARLYAFTFWERVLMQEAFDPWARAAGDRRSFGVAHGGMASRHSTILGCGSHMTLGTRAQSTSLLDSLSHTESSIVS